MVFAQKHGFLGRGAENIEKKKKTDKRKTLKDKKKENEEYNES